LKNSFQIQTRDGICAWSLRDNSSVHKPTLYLLSAPSVCAADCMRNVANLLLVRATRRREICSPHSARRRSLRIVRQMITESVLLSLVAELSEPVGHWGVTCRTLDARKYRHRPSQKLIPPTYFTFCFRGHRNLFGLAPGLRHELNLSESAEGGGRSGTKGVNAIELGACWWWLRARSLSCCSIGAGLLIRSLIQLQNINPGFDAHNVLTMRLDLARQKYPTPDKAAKFFSRNWKSG